MRRSLVFWFLSAFVLFAFSVTAQAIVPIEDAELIDSIVLTIAPSFGQIDELTNSVTIIRPNIGTVRKQTTRQQDDTIQGQQLFVAQSEDLSALASSLFKHGFFDMPEYLETGIMDGDFTWITVTLRSGESKRVGGLLAEEYGPEDFIAIYNAIDQVMLNMIEYETYTGTADNKTAISLLLGQDATIVASENRTTPYGLLLVLSDETVMELVNDAYIQDPNPYDFDGVGGMRHFNLRAVGAGVCSVDLYFVYIGDHINNAEYKESYLYTVEE